VWLWLRRVRHPIALPTLVFLVGHTLIAHKELRFLVPVLPAIPFAVAHALDAALARLRGGPSAWLRRATVVHGAVAACLLGPMTLRPASLPVYYYAFVDAHFSGAYEVWFDGREPMTLGPFDVYFYRPPSYRPHRATVAELEAHATSGSFLFFHDALTLPESPILAARCRPLVQTVPAWMQRPFLVRALDPAILWSLYTCGSPPDADGGLDHAERAPRVLTSVGFLPRGGRTQTL
jgi:hypothetical protein